MSKVTYDIHYSNFEEERDFTSFMAAFKVASAMFDDDYFNDSELEEDFGEREGFKENETIVYSAYVFPGVGFYITKVIKDE